MSFNIKEVVDNYLCPCHSYRNQLDMEIIVKNKTKFTQCNQCSYPWPLFHSKALRECFSCKSHFNEIVMAPESCAMTECYFCGGQIPQMVIIDHYQKIASLHLSNNTDLPTQKVAIADQCKSHNWNYGFIRGQFEKSCNICGTHTIINDHEEILSHSTEFLNCCDSPRTGFSAFRYFNLIMLQCNKCLSETVVTKNRTFEEWLSIGKWGAGFVEVQVMSINDLHVGDHLVYIRQLYEHHVIVVWVNYKDGRFKEIGFGRPFKSSKCEDKLSLEGKIRIYDVLYKTLVDPMVVINYLPLDCYHSGHVLQRAFSRIHEGDYNLISNNCEHLATWCKYGIYECIQVRKVLGKYTKLGQELVNTLVIPNVKYVCEKITKAANEDQTVAQIHNVVASQQENIKEKLFNTLNYICGEKPMTKEQDQQK